MGAGFIQRDWRRRTNTTTSPGEGQPAALAMFAITYYVLGLVSSIRSNLRLRDVDGFGLVDITD